MTERNDEVAEAARRLQEGVARINEDFARLGHTQIHTTLRCGTSSPAS